MIKEPIAVRLNWKFFKSYYVWLIFSVCILAFFLGFQILGYTYRQPSKKTAQLYEQFQKDFYRSDAKAASVSIEQMKQDSRNAPYTDLAVLLAARLYFLQEPASDLVKENLRQAIRSADPVISELAALNLATCLFANADYSEAIAVIRKTSFYIFKAESAHLLGDLLLKAGLPVESRESYLDALSFMSLNDSLRAFVQIKIDSL